MLSLLLPGNLQAAEPFDYFDKGDAASPGELDSLRGGFLMASGMRIDFSIIHESMINGAIQNSTRFSTQDIALGELTPDNFRSILQLGDNNTNLSSALQQIPGIVTIIQNSTDNAVIQNMNMLDIDVQNIQTLRNNRLMDSLRDFQTINNIR